MNTRRLEDIKNLSATLFAWLLIPLLPEKARTAALRAYSINIDAAMIVSSLVQLCIFLYLMISGALLYNQQVFDQLYPAAIKTGDDNVTVGFFMQSGLVSLIGYLFTLRGFFSTLGFLDAAIRLVTYAVVKDPIGSVFCALPIAVYGWTYRLWNQWREKVEFGPVTQDEIQRIPGRESEELIILTARQKDWNPAMTIRYGGIDFHPEAPVRIQHGTHMRYSYRLLRQHEHEIIRRLVLYDFEK